MPKKLYNNFQNFEINNKLFFIIIDSKEFRWLIIILIIIFIKFNILIITFISLL